MTTVPPRAAELPPTFGRRRLALDLALGACLSIFAASLAIYFFLAIGASLADGQRMMNVWFDSDSSRVFDNLTDRASNHYRTSVHPLFSLLAGTPVIASISLFGIQPLTAAAISVALWSACLAASVFTVIRLAIGRTLDAVVYTLLFLSSAGFVFWSGVVESYTLGAVSLVLPLMLVLLIGRGWPVWTLIPASALSLSVTVTNWMAGIAAMLVSTPLPMAIRWTIYAFALVTVLTGLQHVVFPTSGAFLDFYEEFWYSSLSEPRSLIDRAVAAALRFGFDTMVLQGAALVPEPGGTGRMLASLSIGQGPLPALLTAFAWFALLVVGCVQLVRTAASANGLQRFCIALGLVIAGQGGLHLVYGTETFLYAAHFAPLLVIAASLASLSRWRWPCLALAILVSIGAAAHNHALFAQSAEQVCDVAVCIEVSPATLMR
jgi:hypothetical protein